MCHIYDNYIFQWKVELFLTIDDPINVGDIKVVVITSEQ